MLRQLGGLFYELNKTQESLNRFKADRKLVNIEEISGMDNVLGAISEAKFGPYSERSGVADERC